MIRKFAVKLFIFTLPLSLVLASYVVFDPFKVLYKHADYYEDFFVNINRDYVSSRTFVKQYQTHHYNSFIFGSSRTLGFKTKDWRTHLDKGASPYVFDASSESITGIYNKIKFLDKKNIQIKHVLIVLCTDYTFAKEQDAGGVQLVKDPEVEGDYRYLNFQQTFLSAYMHDYFYIRYLKYKLLHKRSEGKWMDFIELKADSVTNDMYLIFQERKLKSDSIAYYKEKDSMFYQRGAIEVRLPEQINADMLNKLHEIRNIFDKQKTDYKLIINPLYDQKKFNEKDLKTLTSIFGKEHLYDYSGINEFTASKSNYYEWSHFKPFVGKNIMDQIYPQ
jgi:hypothetical protein